MNENVLVALYMYDSPLRVDRMVDTIGHTCISNCAFYHYSHILYLLSPIHVTHNNVPQEEHSASHTQTHTV